MNRNTIFSLVTTASIGLSLLSATPAFASTIYGGYGYGYGYNSPTLEKKISVDKKVKNPTTGAMVDGLTLNDPKFVADQAIVFQVIVTNNGGQKLSNVLVKDIVPQYITLTDSSLSYDQNSKTYSVTIPTLNPGESKTFTFTGKIASSAQLPVNSGSFCLVNQATATSDTATGQDNTQFCVNVPSQPTTKGGIPVYPAPVVKTTPKTGPEALVLFALAPLAGVGQFLRKKSV
jgi:uncharacterized repeat protein (TIGR01451 family)